MARATAEFDYVIVGAGAAGCVLAARLSEDAGVSVALLEAGGRDRHPYIHMPAGFAKLTGTRANWGWSTMPQAHLGGKAIWYPQGKVLGGGTSINAQVYTRGNPSDYDRWAEEAGCEDWNYRHVLPYFKKAEGNDVREDVYHSGEGPLGVSMPVSPLPISKVFLRAAQQAGIPFNADLTGPSQGGVGFYQLTQRHARRCSATIAYLRPALTRDNLTLLVGVHATRVIVERGRAVGVEYAPGGGGSGSGGGGNGSGGRRERRTVRARKEVIVASGAIGSPRLLLLSGIGPADELGRVGIDLVAEAPGVGRNLQDHLDLYVVSELTGSHSYDHVRRPHHTLAAALQYLLLRSGPVASNLVDAGGFWYADPDAAAPDIQFHFMLGAGIEHGLERLANDAVTLNSCVLRPRARGTVRLASADPFAAPLIDPNYWGDPHDRAMQIKGFRLAREIMAQAAFEPYVKAERLPGPAVQSDEDIAAYAERHAKTDYHPVGTCAMGPAGGAAVVDTACRAHAVEGLRVADSSVMPLLVSSNTNAATIMLAERAADLIRGRPPLAPADVAPRELHRPRRTVADAPLPPQRVSEPAR